jgi:hypothetical protein
MGLEYLLQLKWEMKRDPINLEVHSTLLMLIGTSNSEKNMGAVQRSMRGWKLKERRNMEMIKEMKIMI